jgi:hypothetical protein
VLATLSSTRSSDLLEKGESSAVALTSGYRLAFLIGAALVVAAMVVAVTVVRPEQKATREPEPDAESVPTAGGKVLSAGR